MDFELPPALRDVRKRVRVFVEEKIVPIEEAATSADARGDRTVLEALRNEAKAAGLYVPHLPEAYGGMGLGVMGMCALFREMGRSPLGPWVFNCDAPDQGNMDLLLRFGSEAQKAEWLSPLAEGTITSAFCMTEPAPGAGADPSNLRTRATAEADGTFRLEGHKWYSTGGRDASVLLVMARTSDHPQTGATLFAVPRRQEGVEYIREIPTMTEPLLSHREAEFRFHGVRLTESQIVGGLGQGFRLAQARLVPARLTHCMRWLGLADRALSMCKAYAATRESFGKTLVHHQLILKKFADNARAIHVGNLMTLHAASLIDENESGSKQAKPYASMAKNHVAQTLCQVLDDAIQMHGGLGYSDDMPFARWYRFARAARIADGPDEVHDASVGRDYLRGAFETLF
ncbi:MAG: acyl-CoA dehydrogenase family protein [Polyangiaceae bacterium]